MPLQKKAPNLVILIFYSFRLEHVLAKKNEILLYEPNVNLACFPPDLQRFVWISPALSSGDSVPVEASFSLNPDSLTTLILSSCNGKTTAYTKIIQNIITQSWEPDSESNIKDARPGFLNICPGQYHHPWYCHISKWIIELYGNISLDFQSWNMLSYNFLDVYCKNECIFFP